MERTKSIIQYSTSIVILIVCAVLCLLLTFLHLLYGGLDDVLLLFISVFFLLCPLGKKKTEEKRCGTFALKGSLVVLGCFLYLFLWSEAFMRCQPLSILMFVIVTIGAIYTSAKSTPTILKVVIVVLFLGTGIYMASDYEIDGPLLFSIIDRPIDRPSQWLHSYRLYWVGMVVHMTVSDASFFSFLLLGGYKLLKKWCT